MKERMILSKPYITYTGNNVRLCSDVKVNEDMVTVYFEVDREFENYLVTERIDSFYIALLPYAMEHNLDVVCEEVLSEKLYYNTVVYYIPGLSERLKYFYNINVTAKTTQEAVKSEKKAGTGISNGVDSLYSILRHMNTGLETYDISYTVLMNTGGCDPEGGEKSQKWFKGKIEEIKPVMKELNKKLLCIDTNLMEFYGEDHTHSGTFRMCGCILALQKLFSTYYIGAGYAMDEVQVSVDNAAYDFLNVQCASSEGLTFYSSGLEVSRLDKVKYISDFPVTYNSISVCLDGFKNCSHCEKCLRTMGELYAINKLDLYRPSFDVDDFYKKKKLRIAEIIARKSIPTKYSKFNKKKYPDIVQSYYKEILAEMKKNGIKVPFISRILAVLYIKPREYLRSKLRTSVLARKIYFKITKKVDEHPIIK